jgi:hypothetical protein
MVWPRDNREELEVFYGRHRLGVDGRPTAAWERDSLMRITLPYPMTLSWDLSVDIRKATCHKKVAESLTNILEQLLDHYGSIQEIKRARMHLFGGCYNFRRVSGSNRLSIHAWGAGIDLDPQKNPLGKPYDESAGMMPKAVVRIFESEGWKWGGRFRSRPDCMHFQAAS